MKINFDTAISNITIQKFCNKYNIDLTNVIMLHEFDGNLYGNYIINLAPDNSKGTHWVSLIYNKNYAVYFDSFGVMPPQIILDRIKCKEIYYQNFIIQNEYSVLCGWFCIGFLYFMQHSKIKSILNRFNKYTKKFFDNPNINDSVIISYINFIISNH